MSRKSYKEKYKELQTQLSIDAKIKDHTHHYIHIAMINQFEQGIKECKSFCLKEKGFGYKGFIR